jgi:hypothetical protein
METLVASYEQNNASDTTETATASENQYEDDNTDTNSLCDNLIGRIYDHTFDEYNDIDSQLIDQALYHQTSGFYDFVENIKEYKSGVELLSLLKKAKCPLYLFDSIVSWASKSAKQFQVDFKSDVKMTRKLTIEAIHQKLNAKGLQPTNTIIYCPGYKSDDEVITHDFAQCLYSLLNDDDLMQSKNLLNDDDGDTKSNRNRIFNDINTGNVCKQALKIYIQNPKKEKLVPIILFC